MQTTKRLSLWIFYGLLGYMPLHVLLATWIGTSVNMLEVAKVFKDVVLVVGFILALICSIKQPWFKKFACDRLLWLIGAYALLTLWLAAANPTDIDAEILGVVYNLRFLVFFVYAGLLTRLFEPKHLKKRATQIVLAVAAIVMFFGIVQYTILPSDALSAVGYNRSNGVLPAFFIDDKPDLERSMSTLRDPNSLGSYIIIIVSLVLVSTIIQPKKTSKQATLSWLALCGLSLVFTFSRSAWLGAAFSMVCLGAVVYRGRVNSKIYKQIILVALSLIALGVAGLYLARDSYLVQNIIFHADKSTVAETPNQLRVSLLRRSVNAVVERPLGRGPGTAGLASIKNDMQGTNLTENYYLQIAFEVGLLGLAFFVAINGWVAWRLFGAGYKDLALALLVSLAGLSIANFLVHIWSNEAVSYTWWGLAGLVVLTKPSRST